MSFSMRGTNTSSLIYLKLVVQCDSDTKLYVFASVYSIILCVYFCCI